MMFKFIIPVAIVVVLGVGGFFLYQNLRIKPTTQPTLESTPTAQVLKTPIPTTSPVSPDPCEVLTKGSSDVPPLYQEGIAWQQPKITEYEVPLGEGQSRKTVGCLLISEKTTDQVGENVRTSYFNSLKSSGWENLISADSPFSGQESYQKDRKLIYIRKYVSAGTQPETPHPPILVDLFYAQ